MIIDAAATWVAGCKSLWYAFPAFIIFGPVASIWSAGPGFLLAVEYKNQTEMYAYPYSAKD